MAIKVYVNDNGTPTLVEMAAESAEALAKLVSAAQAQDFTDEEKAQARENIGAFATTGGTITGKISSGVAEAFSKTADDGLLIICGGTGVSTGATLELHGINDSNSGGFALYARGANGAGVGLTGAFSGELLWNDSRVLTSKDAIPVGTVVAIASNMERGDFLLCNGGAVSRTTYAALFAEIGTTYGSGDGSTTFNLPNLTDRFIQGSGTAGTVKSAGLPDITGTMSKAVGVSAYGTGAFAIGDSSDSTFIGSGSGTAYYFKNFSFYASKSNSIYGNSSTVQPPALTMRFYIKY